MVEKSIYEQIKKQNGETFAKAIRTFDNGIFEVPNIVKIVQYAGRDAGPLLPYLESLKNVQITEETERYDPIKLLDQAGYNAYYVTNLEEQNRISKYYASEADLEKMGIESPGANGEKLCTFRDNNRYKNYYIINAVRKDADKIKRKDFKGKERREDEYGTSVLSIQIAKKGGFISIKNRYNHTVSSPDNTLGSNPDNIIFGLSSALKKHFHVNFATQKVRLPNLYMLFGNQIVHYYKEKDNIYYGPDFYVKDGGLYQIDKDKEVMLDGWILNIKDKTIFKPTNELWEKQHSLEKEKKENTIAYTFDDAMIIELGGRKLKIAKNKEGGHDVLADGVAIFSEKDGQITALNLPTVTEIKNNFLSDNRTLKSFTAQNLKETGSMFLFENKVLETFNAPKLEEVAHGFLNQNKALRQLDLSSLKNASSNFLSDNEVLETFNAPNLEAVGWNFLKQNRTLRQLNLPTLRKVSFDFLHDNEVLETFNAPNLEEVGHNFLSANKALRQLDLPNLNKVDDDFLNSNKVLETFNAPNLEEVGHNFLSANKALRQLDLPNLNKVGDAFLSKNEVLETFNAPNLKEVGSGFLTWNNALRQLYLPNLKKVKWQFLYNNRKLLILNAPKLEKAGYFFLAKNLIYGSNAPVASPFRNWIYESNAPEVNSLRVGIMKGILCLIELCSSKKNNNQLNNQTKVKELYQYRRG